MKFSSSTVGRLRVRGIGVNYFKKSSSAVGRILKHVSIIFHEFHVYIYICLFFFMGAVFLSTRNHVWTCDVFKFMIPFALWIAQETFICEVEVMKSEITQCELAGEGEIVSRVLNPFLFKSSFFIFCSSSSSYSHLRFSSLYRCFQMPCLPHKQPRRQRRQTGTKRATTASPVP